MARFLIVLGLAILVIGLLWPYLSRIGLGRLPGDIVIERDNMSLYFPLVTCLLALEPVVKPCPLGRKPLKRPYGTGVAIVANIRYAASQCRRRAPLQCATSGVAN